MASSGDRERLTGLARQLDRFRDLLGRAGLEPSGNARGIEGRMGVVGDFGGGGPAAPERVAGPTACLG